MTTKLNIVIVEKNGSLTPLCVKEFQLTDLHKKCGFKSPTEFKKHAEWIYNLRGQKTKIQMYGKIQGKAGSENKYEFPPPIDKLLFYGNCALVAMDINGDTYTSLKVNEWETIYEHLYGGFEDLKATEADDENEEDELANVPKEQLTKEGYLKDGFVVDNNVVEYTSDTSTSFGDAEFETSSELSEEEYD